MEEKVADARDEKTGLPIYSLYGTRRRPTPETLKGIDTLVYDIQDAGCRFYTYISTLGYLLEVAGQSRGWMTQPLCGVQWTGNLTANQSRRWFTFNWPATWHMIWTVMPTSIRPGSPQLTWKVQVERASAEFVTYWISVQNLTPDPVTFEGRYCILSRY